MAGRSQRQRKIRVRSMAVREEQKAKGGLRPSASIKKYPPTHSMPHKPSPTSTLPSASTVTSISPADVSPAVAHPVHPRLHVCIAVWDNESSAQHWWVYYDYCYSLLHAFKFFTDDAHYSIHYELIFYQSNAQPSARNGITNASSAEGDTHAFGGGMSMPPKEWM